MSKEKKKAPPYSATPSPLRSESSGVAVPVSAFRVRAVLRPAAPGARPALTAERLDLTDTIQLAQLTGAQAAFQLQRLAMEVEAAHPPNEVARRTEQGWADYIRDCLRPVSHIFLASDILRCTYMDLRTFLFEQPEVRREEERMRRNRQRVAALLLVRLYGIYRIDVAGWIRDLTQEGVEPNPGMSKAAIDVKTEGEEPPKKRVNKHSNNEAGNKRPPFTSVHESSPRGSLRQLELCAFEEHRNAGVTLTQFG